MTESGFRPTGAPDLAVAKSHNDFAMLEPREQLATLLKEHVVGRPFSELAAVTFDHRSEERRVGKECRSRWSPYQ